MQRFIVALAVTAAPIAIGVALALAGYSQTDGAWWTASMQLAVLGGITIMIYGVNVQALPAMNLRMYGHIEPGVVLWPCLPGAAGMLLFATNTAATFAIGPKRLAKSSP